jgi:hypothetical protein
MNIATTILDNVSHYVFYMNRDVSENGFCPRLQMEPAQLGPIAKASPCLRREIGPNRQSSSVSPETVTGPNCVSSTRKMKPNLVSEMLL